MDIDARIRRRRRVGSDRRLVVDYDRLSPIVHVDEPIRRGPLVERLLDHLAPTFHGSLPPNGALWGPKGSGKSAIVSALFDRLPLTLQTGSAIHTATRAEMPVAPQFVYVDGRHANTRFGLYQRVLDGLIEDSVPQQGVGTDWMLDRLETVIAEQEPGAVVAVDHLGETQTKDEEWLIGAFEPIETLSWLSIGRRAPDPTIGLDDDEIIGVDRYQERVLVDILMARATTGLPGNALGHTDAREIAEWAEGDAHDALAALLTAADIAVTDGSEYLRDADVRAGIDAVPRSGVSLGRIFSLPPNRQGVLRALVDLETDDLTSVTTAADAIAADDSLSLSRGTIERFLYQLADAGVIERVPREDTSGKGRPPSRIEERFPARAFRRLYDVR